MCKDSDNFAITTIFTDKNIVSNHCLNEILFILNNKTDFVLICNFSYDTTGITCCQYS